MPKALRRPKYKLFFSLDEPPPRAVRGRVDPASRGRDHPFPPPAGPTAGGRAGDGARTDGARRARPTFIW